MELKMNGDSYENECNDDVPLVTLMVVFEEEGGGQKVSLVGGADANWPGHRVSPGKSLQNLYTDTLNPQTNQITPV